MDFSLTTPALLFPTVSLLLLAYTNRFLTLATVIRNLHHQYHQSMDKALLPQIDNLRYRVYLIKNMQIFGVLSLLFCVVSMFALFAGWVLIGQWAFAIALVLMIISLGISLRELQISSFIWRIGFIIDRFRRTRKNWLINIQELRYENKNRIF